jgi:hypothetical protein
MILRKLTRTWKTSYSMDCTLGWRTPPSTQHVIHVAIISWSNSRPQSNDNISLMNTYQPNGGFVKISFFGNKKYGLELIQEQIGHSKHSRLYGRTSFAFGKIATKRFMDMTSNRRTTASSVRKWNCCTSLKRDQVLAVDADVFIGDTPLLSHLPHTSKMTWSHRRWHTLWHFGLSIIHSFRKSS